MGVESTPGLDAELPVAGLPRPTHPAALMVAEVDDQTGVAALLADIAGWSAGMLGADVATIWLAHESKGRLVAAARYTPCGASTRISAFEAELAARTLTTGRQLVSGDEPPGSARRTQGRLSYLAAPVPAQDAPAGVFTAIAARPGAFGRAHVDLLGGTAQLAALALKRTREWANAAQERNALKATLFSMTEGVFSTDLEGRIVSFNPGAERLTGYAADAVIGRHYLEALALTDEQGQPLGERDCPLRSCIAAKRPAYVPLAFITHREGHRVPVALSTSPILDPLGGPAWCVTILRDVSREREIEQLKTDLVSLVSHELRTPLGHIKGFVSMLRQPGATWGEAARQDFLAEIEAEADRLAYLIANLLDMSHIEAGGLEPSERAPIRAATLMRAAVDHLARELAGRPVAVRVPASVPPVAVDAAQLERVFANLLENAAKYSHPGGAIHLGGRLHDEWVELWVADEGPGVPPEHLERIFEKFYRLQDGTVRRAPGTGLGLAICRAIVAAHGGTLHAESCAGGGVRFVIRLPAAPPGTYAEGGRDETPADPGCR